MDNLELQRLLQASSQNYSDDAAATPGANQYQQQNASRIRRGGPIGGNASLCEQLVFLAENERNSPEILPYPEELISRLQSEMAQRRDEIEKMKSQSHQQQSGGSDDADAFLLGIQTTTNDNNNNNGKDKNPNANVRISASSTLPFRVEDLLNLEMTRLKYAVADLVRVRLQKLQFYRAAIVAEPTRYEPLLSGNELLLVQGLNEIFSNAMLQGGLAQLPEEFQAEPSTAIPRPDYNKYVLACALELCQVQLPGVEEPREMRSGECAICQYHCIRLQLLDGKIRLM